MRTRNKPYLLFIWLGVQFSPSRTTKSNHLCVYLHVQTPPALPWANTFHFSLSRCMKLAIASWSETHSSLVTMSCLNTKAGKFLVSSFSPFATTPSIYKLSWHCRLQIAPACISPLPDCLGAQSQEAGGMAGIWWCSSPIKDSDPAKRPVNKCLQKLLSSEQTLAHPFFLGKKKRLWI